MPQPQGVNFFFFFYCTPDLDFDNICLFSDVRDRNGIWKAI